MKNKTLNLIVSAILGAVITALPVCANPPLHSKHDSGGTDDNPQEVSAVICVVAAVVVTAAVVGIVIVSKKCQPKYYWLMDSEQPPNFWVGTATKKECEINDWKRIGGPYNRPEDAPVEHPPATNRVDELAPVPLHIAVEASTNLTDWTTVSESYCDLEDFAYTPTNRNAGFFRLRVNP